MGAPWMRCGGNPGGRIWAAGERILLCIACLLCYAAFSKRRGDGSALSAAADEVYLLGYLYTISALLGIGLQLWINQGTLPRSQNTILFLAGMKLSTTVVGLIGMLYLKCLAKEWITADSPVDTGRIKLIQDIINAFMEQDLQKFHNTQRSLLSTQEMLNGVMRDTYKHLDTNIQAISQFNAKLQHAGASMEKMNASTMELLKNLEITPQTVAKFNIESQHVNSNMERLNALLIKTAINTQQLCSTQNLLNNNMSEVVNNIKNMKNILDDFVSIVETKVFENDHYSGK